MSSSTAIAAGGVIAAGKGSRLKAIGVPKPLVPVAVRVIELFPVPLPTVFPEIVADPDARLMPVKAPDAVAMLKPAIVLFVMLFAPAPGETWIPVNWLITLVNDCPSVKVPVPEELAKPIVFPEIV